MTQIIPNQKITTDTLPDQFLKVYKWASQNTAETRQRRDEDQASSYKYFWPSPASLLLDSLKLSRGQLIALVGLSGVGKSSAQREIAKSLDSFLSSNSANQDDSASIPRTVYFKWPGKFEANISAVGDSIELSGIINRQEEYLLQIIRKANSDPTYYEKLYDAVSSLKDTTLDALKTTLREAGYSEDAFIKKFLTKGEQKELERELVISVISRCHSILIDMRDYGIDDKRAMAADLSEIQKLWQTIVDRVRTYDAKISSDGNRKDNLSDSVDTSLTKNSDLEVPNFVFVLQKELAMSDEGMVTHFFLGKARVIEISPFSPKELVDYYESEFASLYPFKNRSDLALLASVSRGIFRRFLRYIKLALEGYIQQKVNKAEKVETNTLPPPSSDLVNQQVKEEAKTADNSSEISIDHDMISNSLDSDEIDADWKMDLGRIFHNPRQAAAASELLRALMKLNETNQSTILKVMAKKEEYKLTQSDVSRILSKLEQYGYIRRKRVGNGKIVEINS